MKTSELTGAALDWSVAKCEGLNPYIDTRSAQFCRMMFTKDWEGCDDDLALVYPSMTDRARFGEMCNNIPKYSTDWSQGGPIIERIEGFEFKRWLECSPDTCCEAHIHNYDGDWIRFGSTPLIAAMRCFVASKLGDEIEIPEELK
jgi:hypothetical protein